MITRNKKSPVITGGAVGLYHVQLVWDTRNTGSDNSLFFSAPLWKDC